MIRYPTIYKKQKCTTSKEIANKISDHREFQIVIGIEEDEDVGTQLISMASSSSWALKDFPAVLAEDADRGIRRWPKVASLSPGRWLLLFPIVWGRIGTMLTFAALFHSRLEKIQEWI